MTHLIGRLREPEDGVQPGKRPLYARVLRLRHLEPGKLACALFFEGSIVLATLLAFTDLVSWYGVLALPATVAGMVKLNDVVAGRLPDPHAPRRPARPAPDGASVTPEVRVGPADPEDDDVTAALGFVPVKPPAFEAAETTRLSPLFREDLG